MNYAPLCIIRHWASESEKTSEWSILREKARDVLTIAPGHRLVWFPIFVDLPSVVAPQKSF